MKKNNGNYNNVAYGWYKFGEREKYLEIETKCKI